MGLNASVTDSGFNCNRTTGVSVTLKLCINAAGFAPQHDELPAQGLYRGSLLLHKIHHLVPLPKLFPPLFHRVREQPMLCLPHRLAKRLLLQCQLR